MASGGSGFSDASEQAILDNATVGLGRTLYIALFKWSGTAGAGANNTINDDGTFPTSVAEVSTGGYARVSLASTDWNAATGTAPASKSTNATKSWTASGAAFGELCGWGLYTASTAGTFVAGGTLTNSVGTATSVTVNSGETFQFDATNPIKMQLGDPSDTFA